MGQAQLPLCPARRPTTRAPVDGDPRGEREATGRRCRDARRLVVIGDGAAWSGNLAQELFPQAIPMVDRFHVKEPRSQVAKSIYGETREEAKRGAHRRPQELNEGRGRNLLAALLRQALPCQAARDGWQSLRRNRQRMRYPEFHTQGLGTSSAVREAGGKGVIGTRLQRGGRHCTVRGANPVLALRCCKLSRRGEDFWEQRSRKRKLA